MTEPIRTSDEPNLPRPHRTLWARVAREPLLHFFLIGAAIFFLFGTVAEPPPPRSDMVIEVSDAQTERLAAQFDAVWRRAPSDAELSALLDDFIREEVYYREALALGLDRDDMVIRRRLRQKMEFLSAAGADSVMPDDAVLRDHFAAHSDRFTPAARITFDQVFLGDADPEAALDALAAGAEPADLGRATLIPPDLRRAPKTEVDGIFGAGFFDAVSRLSPGTWQGPVTSGYGGHLVRVSGVEPAITPHFETVRDDVERDWRQQTAEDLRERQYEVLRSRYEVVRPEPVVE